MATDGTMPVLPPPSRCRYNALEWMMPVKNTMNFLTKVRVNAYLNKRD